jgi:hypothetical protein
VAGKWTTPPEKTTARVLTHRHGGHHSIGRVYKAAPVLAAAKRDLDNIVQHISEVRVSLSN